MIFESLYQVRCLTGILLGLTDVLFLLLEEAGFQLACLTFISSRLGCSDFEIALPVSELEEKLASTVAFPLSTAFWRRVFVSYEHCPHGSDYWPIGAFAYNAPGFYERFGRRSGISYALGVFQRIVGRRGRLGAQGWDHCEE